MKKVFVIVTILALAFLTFGLVSCKTPPPQVIEEPPPPLPPPPPPPPPVIEDLELSVKISPRYFSPDGDGIDDELTIHISVKNHYPIDKWNIEIHEPYPPYNIFREWSGEGKPPAAVMWDGYSESGELLQSASEYPLKMTLSDEEGNETFCHAIIEVDVLVMHDGDLLRAIVPSIAFAPNTDHLTAGIADELIENNDYILTRIAEVLKKFNTYNVIVEGHANPTTAPGTRARTIEENGDRSVKGLQPLSEERAKAVVDYLVHLGVESERLTAIGKGGSRTVIEFADKENWWKNRRVEFILIKEAPDADDVETLAE